MTVFEASAPAKIILLGEHAVVHGQPAIAVPLSSLRARATVEPGERLTIIALDTNETVPVDLTAQIVENALELMARLVLEHTGCPPPPVTIRVSSDIPLASGFGSGAAVSSALGRALAQAVGVELGVDDLNRMVYRVEQMHHGIPSGIDNTVIVYEQPVYFVRHQPIELLKITRPFTLVVGDTGAKALTHVSVGDVNRLYETHPVEIGAIFERIGRLVKQARQAIEGGSSEMLGPLMNENHALLQQLTVSSPELDRLVAAARNAGASGAKLSGGGRGGNIIALCEPERAEQVAAALSAHGAARVIVTRIGA
jgi:mevalonate kinase